MSDLAKKECIPCKGGVPPMELEQAQGMIEGINSDWELIEILCGKKLMNSI